MGVQGDFFNQQFGFDFDDTPVSNRSILDEVVNTILDELKTNPDGRCITPWSRTYGLPVNAYTKKPYEGRNMLLLWASAARNGFRSNRWATFLQWQSLRSPVPKGYRATRIFIPIVPDEQGSDDAQNGEMIFRPIPVFNADQVNHRTPEQPELIPLNLHFDESKAKELISAVGVAIQTRGARAFYNHDEDFIAIPPRSAFTGTPTSNADESYYSVIFHEIIHWTGHRSRCNRPIGKRRDSIQYAMEELVAEIGATLLCHNLGISPEIRPDHIHYIQSWKRNLTEEPENLVKAAEQAVQAVKFLQQSTAQITLEF